MSFRLSATYSHPRPTLLSNHRVLTSVQIARLLFASDNVARKRLAKLTARGILARFRTCPGVGSVPWRYTLGPLGAMITAADHGHTPPVPRKTHERMLAVSRSKHLDHLLGINDFFSRLAFHARTHTSRELTEWRNERQATRMCADIAHPDGYGQWLENSRPLRFFLEYDNSTETLDQVAAKLDAYRDMADAGLTLPILFVFAGPRRHTTFHQMINHQPTRLTGLSVTTTSTTDIDLHGPAETIWLPAHHNTRRPLITLTEPATRTA